MEYYSATKKNRSMPFTAIEMEQETLLLSEVKSKRERHILYDITYIWNLIYSTQKKIMDWRIDLWLPRGSGESGIDWELGVNRCKFLVLEWTRNEILLCSTGTMSSHLWCGMIMWENTMCTCRCNWLTMMYSRKQNYIGKITINKRRKSGNGKWHFMPMEKTGKLELQYSGCQPRGLIRDAGAKLSQTVNNAVSYPCLWHTPRLTTKPGQESNMQPHCSWSDSLTTEPWQVLP